MKRCAIAKTPWRTTRERTGRNTGWRRARSADRTIAGARPRKYWRMWSATAGAAQRRQHVDEAQQLDAELGVAGRPVEQALLPPLRRQGQRLLTVNAAGEPLLPLPYARVQRGVDRHALLGSIVRDDHIHAGSSFDRNLTLIQTVSRITSQWSVRGTKQRARDTLPGPFLGAVSVMAFGARCGQSAGS